MKKYIINTLILILTTIVSYSCIDMMEEVKDVETVEPITVSYKVSAATGFIEKGANIVANPNFSTQGVEVTFTNIKTSQVIKGKTDQDCIVTVELDPGVYSIGVDGTANYEGYDYFINSNIASVSLFKNIERSQAETDPKYGIVVRPAKVGALCISEIYYCGIAPYYFRDQTYQIYNNGKETFYLDGVCFAQMHPNIAFASSTPPIWPDEDGVDNFAYALTVWQFPGNGSDYPLQPGESVIIVQEARDHTQNNPKSYDNSKVEWECNTGNVTRDNPDIPNMPNIFETSHNSFQWLSSVFGGAFCIFKPTDGIVVNAEYYSKDGPNVQNEVNKTSKYAKIPADWILDGVELLGSMDLLSKKRIPGFIDAGASSVNETYCGKSVSRKVISTNSDNTPVLMDTNNSTNDFQVNDSPKLRRNGEKVPSWSPSK